MGEAVMNASYSCVDFIRKHEGFRAKAYRCSSNVWTIGFGHTQGVKPGEEISYEIAEKYLLQDISFAEKSVRDLVSVELTQGQFDALTSFVFNVGRSNFAKSTLLRLLNEGNYSLAGKQLLRWVFSSGVKSRGLVARREKELYELYSA